MTTPPSTVNSITESILLSLTVHIPNKATLTDHTYSVKTGRQSRIAMWSFVLPAVVLLLSSLTVQASTLQEHGILDEKIKAQVDVNENQVLGFNGSVSYESEKITKLREDLNETDEDASNESNLMVVLNNELEDSSLEEDLVMQRHRSFNMSDNIVEASRQFDAFDDVLVELLLTVVEKDKPTTGGHRSARNISPFSPPTSCTISTDELAMLLETLSTLTRPMTELTASGTTSPGGCPQLAEILRAVADLRRKFNELMTVAMTSADYDALKAGYENDMKKLQKQIDDLRANADQKTATNLDLLQTEYQKLLKTTNAALKDLEKVNKELRESYVLLCVAEIKNGAISSAVTRFNSIMDKQMVLETIIKDSYSNNLNNGENVLAFLAAIRWATHSGKGYEYFLTAIQRSNSLNGPLGFMLAYRVKESLSSPSVSAAGKTFMTTLKSRLPATVRNVLWERLCLRNTYHNEYLYASDQYAYDAQRRRVFTWSHKGQRPINPRWRFEATANGKRFKVINADLNEYLYAENDNYNFDAMRRRVFTWRGGRAVNQGEWDVQVYSNNQIRLRNVWADEHLHGTDDQFAFCDQRRRVFTWKPKGALAQGIWELTVC